MNRLLPLLASLTCAAVAQAQDAQPAESPVPSGASALPVVAPYQLKTKSLFDVAEGSHAPFVPIGWVKRAGPAPVVQTATIDESAFQLTSILLGNPSLAVINGRSYEEGQFLRLPRGSAPLRIRVHRIADGQVWLQFEDRIFTVPLKRPELTERKLGKPVLLSEERDIDPALVPPTPPPAPAPAPAAATPAPKPLVR